MTKRKTKAKPIPSPSVPTITSELIVLVADGQMKQVVATLLAKRGPAMGFTPPTMAQGDLITHSEKDGGCVNRPDALLASYLRTHRRAIVMFDREGCGQESKSREGLEDQVETLLAEKGWGDRARAIVFDPELEQWIWSRSVHVANALGWVEKSEHVYDWLLGHGFLAAADQVKPTRPKEAVEAVLREVRKPRSGAIYAAIAEKASVAQCQDPAFLKFRDTLREWFPPSAKGG